MNSTAAFWLPLDAPLPNALGRWWALPCTPTLAWVVIANYWHDGLHFSLSCDWRVNALLPYGYLPPALDDPLSHAQAPCLSDFQVVRELQRGSHAAVFMVRKVQTGDVCAMKVIDRQRGRSHERGSSLKPCLATVALSRTNKL